MVVTAVAGVAAGDRGISGVVALGTASCPSHLQNFVHNLFELLDTDTASSTFTATVHITSTLLVNPAGSVVAAPSDSGSNTMGLGLGLGLGLGIPLVVVFVGVYLCLHRRKNSQRQRSQIWHVDALSPPAETGMPMARSTGNVPVSPIARKPVPVIPLT